MSSITDGVYIHPNTVLGKNFSVESGAKIGVRGLALYDSRQTEERWRFEEFHGKVIVGDNVHIGANTCVERGTTSDTIIGDGTKIDLLCCIGHDSKIGKNCRITPLAILLGGVELGDNVFVGSGASIRSRVKIGNDAVVGMGAVVLQDVPAGKMVYGVPPHFKVEGAQRSFLKRAIRKLKKVMR